MSSCPCQSARPWEMKRAHGKKTTYQEWCVEIKKTFTPLANHVRTTRVKKSLSQKKPAIKSLYDRTTKTSTDRQLVDPRAGCQRALFYCSLFSLTRLRDCQQEQKEKDLQHVAAGAITCLRRRKGKGSPFFYSGCAKAFGRHKFSLSPPYPLFFLPPPCHRGEGGGENFFPKQRRGKGGRRTTMMLPLASVGFPLSSPVSRVLCSFRI